jgi:hypothetical protein
MDQHRFNALTRTLSSVPTRRDVLRGLAGVGLGLGALRWPDVAEAGTRCTRKRRKQCRRAGKTCLSNGSCAIVCTTSQDCPATDCLGGCANPNPDGAQYCIASSVDPVVLCGTTDACPQGSYCQNSGGIALCMELCH